MACHEARLRVRYAETDQMGVVYYANYLVWMEVGRVESARRWASTTATWSARTASCWRWPKRTAATLFPARFDDEVVVKTWIERASRRLVAFGYEMRLAEDGRVLASGETKHVFCGLDLRPGAPAREILPRVRDQRLVTSRFFGIALGVAVRALHAMDVVLAAGVDLKVVSIFSTSRPQLDMLRMAGGAGGAGLLAVLRRGRPGN